MNTIDFRLGNYQDVLQAVTCDALICDPPYSERTHKGRRTGSELRQSNIKYDSIDQGDANELAEFFSERTRWWAVIFGDHITREFHAKAWESVGWNVFPPVRWVKPNAPPRMSGDGSAVSTEDILIARRRLKLPKERMGSRPGHYIYPTQTGGNINTATGKAFPGSKPINLMRALLNDYTNKGDVVCDPFSGTGTTLIAAAELGRFAIGSERTESTYQQAKERLNAGYTPDMLEAI